MGSWKLIWISKVIIDFSHFGEQNPSSSGIVITHKAIRVKTITNQIQNLLRPARLSFYNI